jgi:RNA polymerase sigma-70 factor (ECF subfamily)
MEQSMASSTGAVTVAVEQAFAQHWARLLALLARQLRSLDLAEESLADAFERAVRHWEHDGVPDSPEAWLLTTARRRGLDLLRREATLARKLPSLVVVTEPGLATYADARPDDDGSESSIPDERLRLLFTCCHPALAMEARIALTLRLVGGLTTAEIGRAFLVTESTMAARLTRAKKKIAAAAIPYRVPTDAELPERLDGVLTVLYVVFTEGHSASSGDALVRRGLCDEAIRLNRVVAALLPTEPDPLALLALMLLHHSRRDARTDEDGQLILLADQDRRRWHQPEIAEGVRLIERAATFERSTSYLLQAGIAAEHATAPSAADTDWAAIETQGPATALALLADLDGELAHSHLLPAARADFLRRLGRRAEARAEYTRALGLVGNASERDFFTRRLAELADLDKLDEHGDRDEHGARIAPR